MEDKGKGRVSRPPQYPSKRIAGKNKEEEEEEEGVEGEN